MTTNKVVANALKAKNGTIANATKATGQFGKQALDGAER